MNNFGQKDFQGFGVAVLLADGASAREFYRVPHKRAAIASAYKQYGQDIKIVHVKQDDEFDAEERAYYLDDQGYMSADNYAAPVLLQEW